MCVRGRERECVCVREGERENVCVCVCERERERERESVCVCVCERERERERVCVCVREREREDAPQMPDGNALGLFNDFGYDIYKMSSNICRFLVTIAQRAPWVSCTRERVCVCGGEKERGRKDSVGEQE